MIVGFTTHYGHVSNFVAKGIAHLDSLKLAHQLGIQDLMLESNSKVILGWINFEKCNLWYFWDYWDDIKQFFSELNCNIHHIFRETNMVVDYLAKEGTYNLCKYITDCDIGGGTLRGLLHTDYWGLPYIRF